MFGMGWTEILLIGIVALIVVGPKELPGLFRSVGQFVGKARGMAREFSRAMEDAADESGVRSATNSLKAMSNPSKFGLDKVRDAANPLKWEAPKPSTTPAKPSLSEDRAEAKSKIEAATAAAARKRQADEAAAAKGESTLAVPEIKTPKPAATPRPAVAEAPAAPAQPALRQTPAQRAAGLRTRKPVQKMKKGAARPRPGKG